MTSAAAQLDSAAYWTSDFAFSDFLASGPFVLMCATSYVSMRETLPMKKPLRIVLFPLLLLAALVSPQTASAQDRFYYWVAPHLSRPDTPQSFVIEVNSVRKAQIDAILARGSSPGFAGVVAAESASYNKNYSAPGEPVWNWHIASIKEIFDLNQTLFPQVVSPVYDAHPSEIAADPEQWIKDNGEVYVPRHYSIQREIKEGERFYYWATPYPNDRAANRYESFVIELDFGKKVQFDQVFAKGPVFFEGQIAAGSAPYNKNYHAPSQPVWNWHFTSIDKFYPGENAPYSCFSTSGSSPQCDAHPSEIAANPEQWIAQHGTRYFPTKYLILGRAIEPSKKGAVANVSNRGMTGAGEKTVITGLIITGGEPRTVVLRAIGPSLSAAGVQQVAADPKLTVYRGSSSNPLSENDNWKADSGAEALQRHYPSLAPANDSEAAVMLTLMPGRYTLHGSNADGSEGVLLLEAYDVDTASE